MRIEIKGKKVKYVDQENKAHLAYKLQFWDENNNPMDLQPVAVQDDKEVICTTDTNLDGEADIEIITDIIKETKKKLNFIVGRERKAQIFLLEANDPDLQNAIESQPPLSNEDRIHFCKRFFPKLNRGIVNECGGEVLIDDQGNKLSQIFDQISDFDRINNLVARKKQKSYLINGAGQISTNWYDSIEIHQKVGLYKVIRAGQHAVINSKDIMFIPWSDKPADLGVLSSTPFYIHRLNGKKSLKLNKGGEIPGWYSEIICFNAIEHEFDDIAYSSKFFKIRLDNEIALTDEFGSLIVKIICDDIEFHKFGILAKFGNEFACISPKGIVSEQFILEYRNSVPIAKGKGKEAIFKNQNLVWFQYAQIINMGSKKYIPGYGEVRSQKHSHQATTEDLENIDCPQVNDSESIKFIDHPNPMETGSKWGAIKGWFSRESQYEHEFKLHYQKRLNEIEHNYSQQSKKWNDINNLLDEYNYLICGEYSLATIPNGVLYKLKLSKKKDLDEKYQADLAKLQMEKRQFEIRSNTK